MKMDICLSSDINYAKYMGTTIASILKNAEVSDEFVFHIIDDGIGEYNKNKILELKNIKDFKVKFYTLNSNLSKIFFSKVKDKCYYSSTTMNRLSIHNLIKDVDKILYLDGDVVVLDSLRELFNIDINNFLGLVCNHQSEPELNMKVKNILGLSKNDIYFNAGVIMINSKLWREKNITDQFIDCVNKFDNLVFGDQDILNYTLKDKVKIIPSKWNFNSHKIFNDEIDNPADNIIIHYITGDKPWKENHGLALLVSEFWKYYMLTPWFKDNPSWAIDIMIKQKLNNYKPEVDWRFYDLYSKIDNKYSDNWIKIFGIYNNKQYLKIIFFSISIVLKMDTKKINKIAWWIPVHKWRDDFRKKFQ